MGRVSVALVLLSLCCCRCCALWTFRTCRNFLLTVLRASKFGGGTRISCLLQLISVDVFRFGSGAVTSFTNMMRKLRQRIPAPLQILVARFVYSKHWQKCISAKEYLVAHPVLISFGSPVPCFAEKGSIILVPRIRSHSDELGSGEHAALAAASGRFWDQDTFWGLKV